MKKPPPDLQALAKRRLERLREPSPEELAKEIAEAERNGDKLLVLPGGLRVLLKLYGREPAAKE